MANPTCNQATIFNACFVTPGAINPKEQKAYLLYAMVIELAAIGGANYADRLAALLKDAATLCCGMGEPERKAALVQIAFNKAGAAGSRATQAMTQTAVNCYVEATDEQLDEAFVLLSCLLGVNKSYPQ